MNVRVIWVRVSQATLGQRMYTMRSNYSMHAQSGFGYCGLWTGFLGSDVTGDMGVCVFTRDQTMVRTRHPGFDRYGRRVFWALDVTGDSGWSR